MNPDKLDRQIRLLQKNRQIWARLPISTKRSYVRQVLKGTLEVADAQVMAAQQAKGLAPDTPLAGEEWLTGPIIVVRNLRLLANSLKQIEATGRPQLKPSGVRTREDGQVVVDVFPMNFLDKLLFKDFRAEVWMQPGVTAESLDETMAVFYQQEDPRGRVALVLGAGNVASIGPLDMAYRLFVEGQVCLYKFNPVNDYLQPFVEQAFASLIEDGFLRIVTGGADVGEYLCQHPEIEEIHITGSHHTHDAIVYGTGEGGAQRKQQNKPRMQKQITSELGCVSPVIVVPGAWSEADLSSVTSFL